MATLYRHRQFGTLTVAILVAVTLLVLGIAGRLPEAAGAARITFSVAVVLVLLVLLFFSSLTVTVDREWVQASLGIGLIRRRLRTAYVLEANPVRNRWWYGWGVRLTPHGWMFNVSGLDAVELTMADGRRFRIGTDRPAELAAAIRQARLGR